MVEVGTGGAKTRFVKREWPVEEGLTAGTEKQEGTKRHLEIEETSIVRSNKKVGL